MPIDGRSHNKNMKKRIKGFLRKTTAALGVSALILGASYLLFGWGLSTSDVEASYRFIEYWSETAGKAFEEPFATAVDSSNGGRRETLDTFSMRAGSATAKVRALPVTGILDRFDLKIEAFGALKQEVMS